MALTKKEIKDNVHKRLNIPYEQANDIVELLFEIIKSNLSFGKDILITGFGKFRVNTKKERLGRNPATGERMMLDARRVVTFHISKKLKENINNAPAAYKKIINKQKELLECKRCGHQWVPRVISGLPKTCSKCNTRNWQKAAPPNSTPTVKNLKK